MGNSQYLGPLVLVGLDATPPGQRDYDAGGIFRVRRDRTCWRGRLVAATYARPIQQVHRLIDFR